MDVRALVGRNFRRLRLRADLTQEDVQERAGFSQQYVSELENGKCNPELETLFGLAKAVGASAVDLVTMDEVAVRELKLK
ncbi:helix-turn-helix domain-containing protein [Vitreimonas flagellata]|jgi:transcriptional regulator with XRE-family HTH domain|uniref:helix-turn-helix domain-containing protein n=1 Tax=Vitreimonas flagellata TaxID=2560861 RepID=UPI001074AFF6